MKVAVSVNGRYAVIEPAGRLDLLSAADVKREIVDAITRGGSHVVVDLGEVTFIDSSGLGALIGGLRAAREAGGDLRIARPNEQARLVLQLTRLDRVLTSYDTPETALEAFGR